MNYTNSEMELFISEHVHSKRNREILRLHYIDGETFEKTAAIMELSTRRVADIVAKWRRAFERHQKNS